MIGQTLAHYRITSAIGAGGMGEVYRATDTKLGREVALKVLPAEMACDPERLERFQREARAVAALNHPHIVTLHSVEEADGVHFLTMELVEGQPLDRVIPRGGLAVDRLLAVASAIADALSAAHAKGIVHRDLKPANVMVTAEGRVKVLDFGLAKFADEGAHAGADAATALQTRDGVVMGTVPYMSPEQIAGRPVDHRTDIFSLGVILYEMAGGQRPFHGTSSAELASAILRDTPPSICLARADLPQALGRVIERCLEKSAADRFATSSDLADRLRGVTADAPAASTAKAVDSRPASKVDSGASRADEGFWVAVVPFKSRGTDAELSALAEGLSEEIVTGLSRFSYLRVIARGATLKYAHEAMDVRTVGKEIGARYVIEGSLRQAGATVRVAVQLVDASSGAHLWAETYNRPFRPDAIFDLQDDLVPRIVSTVADWYGVLPHTMSESVRNKAPDQLTPYEAVLRGFGYYERVTPDEHAAVRAALERAVQQAPGYADAWAMLSMMYGEEHRFRFNVRPDPLGRALQAARRAADAAPASHAAFLALAQALYFRKELPAFRSAAERAIALNPMDGSTCEYVGHLMAFGGDWERGCDVAEKARQLNPHHPGWYWALPFYDAYRKGDYRGAEPFALKMNMAGMDLYHVMLAALYGQLGEREAAERELQQLRAVAPDYALIGRRELGKWYPPDLVEQLIDGLRKAGLKTAPPEATAAFGESGSGAARQNEGFWVAVLPFKYRGTDTGLDALAEGLSEEIVTGLSRFSYLKVIARSSTERYAGETVDVRDVGKQLGARYVMEGSLRQAGSILRVAMQLVDAVSGAHLWAETYERPFRSDEVFALQDDLAPRIVSTVADMQGVLPYSMSETLRDRPADELSPYEALLRSFGFLRRITADEHAAVRAILERATQKAPNHADCWAMLSAMYTNEYIHGFNALPDPLGRALQAARHAVEAAPSNHFAHYALAEVLFYRREIQAFRNAAERAIALNRMDGYSTAYMGMLLAFAGEWERGCGLVDRGMQLNPNHPKWLWIPLWVNLYRTRDYPASLDAALKIDVPHHWYPLTARAATYGQMGDREAGQKAVRELRALKPDFAVRARQEFAKWHEADLIEHLVDGLRKSGLDVPPAQPSAADVARDVRPAGRESVAIAVLPFSDMSPAKDQEYLCEGMAEEIMNALVRIDGIRVASRTSAFRARHDHGDLPAIARALSVGHVLEGSVRTSGNRLRVTAQLTDVGSGYQLWSERFDRDAADVFAVQDEIATGVVEAVKTRLAPGERTVRVRSQAHNLEAYRCYLKARHLRYAKEDYAGALGAFEQAVRLDPSHAPSWTGLAEIQALAAHMNVIPPHAACASARAALATASGLQGESADGCHVEGFIALIERRWDAMETAWRRALELQPTHVQALGSFGIALCARQRLDEALPLFERARHADPLGSFPYMITGGGLLNCGQPAEAERYFDDALSFEKEDASALFLGAMAKVALGKFEEAIALAEHTVAVSRRTPHFLGVLGFALAAAGRTDEARTLLDELRARPAASPALVAEGWLLGALGETDAAFELFARAEAECQALLCYTGWPGFDPLRADPRFHRLLERLALR